MSPEDPNVPMSAEGERIPKEIGFLRSVQPSTYYRPQTVKVADDDRKLMQFISLQAAKHLEKNYQAGFGVFPAAGKHENFYGQLWVRDFAHAAGNYFVFRDPAIVEDSLRTLLKYQKPNGALPFRVERDYMILKVIPGLRYVSQPVFNLVERGILRRRERPVYEGWDFSGSEDTVPAIVMAAGSLFIHSLEGQEFIGRHFQQLKKAIKYFQGKVDPRDGLAYISKINPDWADSINRGGKLGCINVWWGQALRTMSYMARNLNDKDADYYHQEFHKVKRSVEAKLYNHRDDYFRAVIGQDRLDTVASVHGSMYFSGPRTCARVQETLRKRVLVQTGLKNFDPPYPFWQILIPHYLVGLHGYHNKYVWPWVTLDNIQVKIKIALLHPEPEVRVKFKKEAVFDLLAMAELFQKAGGAYEIFEPHERRKARTLLYSPPRNLMANLASYMGAYLHLRELKWL